MNEDKGVVEVQALNLKHSGLGISSFIIALIIGFFVFVIVMFAGYVEMTTPGGMNESSVAAVLIGLAIIFGLFVSIIGLGLGIGGLFQKNKKKVFPILGIVMNGAIILGVSFLVIIGILSQSAWFSGFI